MQQGAYRRDGNHAQFTPLIADLIFKGEVAQIKEVMGKSNRAWA